MTPDERRFWELYLDTVEDRSAAEARFFGAFSVGSSEESAHAGAQLILAGSKTATSDPVARLAHAGETAPTVGALSLVLDGGGAPVAVVETVEIAVRNFDAVDAAFAHDYGEWDRSLDAWRRELSAYYSWLASNEGWTWANGDLVCERFRVMFRG